MAETKFRPPGSASVTCTLLAALGPLSERVTVKVTVSPTFGVGLLTVLLMARSACCGVSVAEALLFAEFGSNWSARLIDTLFVRTLPLFT